MRSRVSLRAGMRTVRPRHAVPPRAINGRAAG
jgi:hypothetical protein